MSGLTEKKLQNKRFMHSEEAIICAFLSVRDYVSVDLLISRAQVSRSTFYRHHKNVRRIVLDYEDYLLNKFAKTMESWEENKELRFYFKQLLIFIVANKKIMLFLVQHGGKGVLEELIMELEPIIIGKIKIPRWAETAIIVYRSEAMGLLEKWAEEDFYEGKLNRVLENIVYLTASARERLAKLDN